MPSSRKDLMISLEALQLLHPALLGKSGAYLLRSSLLMPRPNVDERDSLRSLVGNEAGVLMGPSTPFHIKTLFKQTVEGPFTLALELSEAVKENAIADIVAVLAQAAIGSAGNATAMQALPQYRSGIRSTAKFFSDKVQLKESPDLLAEHYAFIKAPRKGRKKVKLLACNAIEERVVARGTGKRGRRIKAKRIVEAGGAIAEAVIKFEPLS